MLHEARLTAALIGMRLRAWPFAGAAGIREASPAGDRTDIHVFDQWRHLGTASSDEELWEIVAEGRRVNFDLDSYRILTRFLGQRKHNGFIDLSFTRNG